MDAVEYLKTMRRLCKSQANCPECPLHEKFQEDGYVYGYVYCIADVKEYAEKAVQIVEQWGKEHPIKTRQSEFLEKFPDAPINEGDGILCVYPCYVEGAKKIGCANGKGCNDCRKEYWLNEVDS